MKTSNIINHIVQWLDTYLVDTSGLNGFIIGVSGGIDSAVTSTLCAKTGKPVIALNMPICQAENQVSLSSAHIKWLKTRYKNVTGIHVELTPVFELIKQTLPDSIQDGLTMANTRSRLRMLTLYAFASNHKMLVAGTGNRVEDFGVGFYTKYGDGGVDLSPIAGLMKTEVYELAKELGILQQIQTAAPTDGLWEDDRTDESQIGATYAELEWAMRFIDLDIASKNSLSDRQKEVLCIYKKFHTANQHKMDPIPVCHIPQNLLD
ncbi:MAG: NAD(+) synthase [Pseudomonadota bacterium]